MHNLLVLLTPSGAFASISESAKNMPPVTLRGFDLKIFYGSKAKPSQIEAVDDPSQVDWTR